MLYTKKGDDGLTTAFGCDQRISKSSAITEALGALDETNSFLGICKAKIKKDNQSDRKILDIKISDLTEDIQNNLFVVQAEVAGADKNITTENIELIEKIIGEIEKELPPIKTFIVSGSCIHSANFDFARTLVRRAERRVVAVGEEGKVVVSKYTLIYLNRLSSILFAVARLLAVQSEVKEMPPKY
ncbi:MAG: cob(I)yrinic acid a,c-diamide adenosyltransferase [bacterium]